MKSLVKILAIAGILIIAYAIFSRFYGAPSIAMMRFKSSNILVLGNSTLLISLVLQNMAK